MEFNPAAETLFGYPRGAVIGRDLADLVIPPALRERHRRGIARYLASGEGPILNKRSEMPARRADGSELWVELAITPIDGGRQRLFTGFLRDISERRASEAALREHARLAFLRAMPAPLSPAARIYARSCSNAPKLSFITWGRPSPASGRWMRRARCFCCKPAPACIPTLTAPIAASRSASSRSAASPSSASRT